MKHGDASQVSCRLNDFHVLEEDYPKKVFLRHESSGKQVVGRVAIVADNDFFRHDSCALN